MHWLSSVYIYVIVGRHRNYFYTIYWTWMMAHIHQRFFIFYFRLVPEYMGDLPNFCWVCLFFLAGYQGIELVRKMQKGSRTSFQNPAGLIVWTVMVRCRLAVRLRKQRGYFLNRSVSHHLSVAICEADDSPLASDRLSVDHDTFSVTDAIVSFHAVAFHIPCSHLPWWTLYISMSCSLFSSSYSFPAVREIQKTAWVSMGRVG